MNIGVTFPRDGLRNDPSLIRDFAQAAESLGYAHIHAGDHVLGRSGLQDSGRPIIDPFILFPHLAAVTTTIRFFAGIMVLPQRQTALVARQAANIDVMCGGRLEVAFSVGWNAAEYEALNENFHNRGRRMDEQIEVLRLLWTQPSVDFSGRFHRVDHLGVNPLPIQQPIPIWMAGYDERALHRIARLADGWFPHSPPGVAPGAGPEIVGETLARLRSYLVDEGRDVAAFRINGTIRMLDRSPEQWRSSLEAWRAAGASHATLSTITSPDQTPDDHLEAMRRFREEVMAGMPG
jgi:probable F420-dependent oxidoreductase